MRRKRIFGIVLSALLIIPTFLSLIRLSGYVFATSISEAESICNQLGGKFLDNSQSEGAQNGSEDAAKCSQIPNSSDPNKKTICESSEGSYSVNTQTCNWRYVDDITVEHSAAALKTLCESNSGTFTDLSASHNEATCHNLPATICYANGGTDLSGICKWTHVKNDISTGTDPTEEEGAGEGSEATCHSESGALGWILCPVLEFAASAASWAYESVVMPNLETNPQLFKIDDARNGTYQAWQIFRDFANAVFVIFLLFVILSQLTGIGIDNYGIKKSLPKLITAAILVNLSFFICQACVDLSNIVGHGSYEVCLSAGGVTVTKTYNITKYSVVVLDSEFGTVEIRTFELETFALYAVNKETAAAESAQE